MARSALMAGTRCLWMQGNFGGDARSGDWAPRRRLDVFPLQHLAGRPGEGVSPDSNAPTSPGSEGARGSGRGWGSAGRSSRPMARPVNKSGPPGWSPAEQHRTAASDPRGPRKKAHPGVDRARGPGARTRHCLRAPRMLLEMRPPPRSAAGARPRVPTPGLSAQRVAAQGERPGSVAETTPGLEVPKSGTQTHPEPQRARPPRS